MRTTFPRSDGRIQVEHEGGGFSVFTNDAYDLMTSKGVGVYAMALYMALCRHASSSDRTSYPSMKRLQKQLGASRNTLIKAIKTLESHGLIRVLRRKTADGGHDTHLFKILRVRPQRSEDNATSAGDTSGAPESAPPPAPKPKVANTKPSKQQASKSQKPTDALFEALMLGSFDVGPLDQARRKVYAGRVARLMYGLLDALGIGRQDTAAKERLAAELPGMYAWHAEQLKDGAKLSAPASVAGLMRTLERHRQAKHVEEEERPLAHGPLLDLSCTECDGTGIKKYAIMPDQSEQRYYGIVPPAGYVTLVERECECITRQRR